MFFDYVQQIPEAIGKPRLYHVVFARRIKSGVGLVFSVREPIRTRIAHGLAGVRVFVQGRTRAMG